MPGLFLRSYTSRTRRGIMHHNIYIITMDSKAVDMKNTKKKIKAIKSNQQSKLIVSERRKRNDEKTQK